MNYEIETVFYVKRMERNRATRKNLPVRVNLSKPDILETKKNPYKGVKLCNWKMALASWKRRFVNQ